jgi:hypothetical protein
VTRTWDGWLMNCGSVASRRIAFCYFPEFTNRLCSTHSPFQRTREILSSGYAVDHSPQSSLKFKNVWSYTSFPPYAFMVWHFIKHRDVFILVDQHAEFSRTGGFSFHLRLLENKSDKSVTHDTDWLTNADTSGRAVWGVCLRPIPCWDWGIESRRGHGRLYLVSVACCQVEIPVSSLSVVQRRLTELVCLSVIVKPW